MSGWLETTLGEACELYQPKTISSAELVADGEYPVYGANGVIGRFDKFNHAEPQLLITCRGATCGSVNISQPNSWINGNAMVVKPKDISVELDYLKHLFNGGLDLSAVITGAAQPQITRQSLAPLKVRFPAPIEQRRIAAMLDQADALRVQRREALAQLDILTQSIFIEMFGNPITNPFNWPRATLGDLILSASDGPHVSPKYSDSGVPFISTRHVRPGEISWDDLKFISKEEAAIQWKKCKPEQGDILYTKGGTTGFAAVVKTNESFAIWVHVALLKPNLGKIHSVWLEAMLNSSYCYRQSQELTHGIANRDLGLKRMVRIAMYQPPIALQYEFISRITEVEQLKSTHRGSMAGLNALFASLQHRAFRGEL